jgi:hypothetical protein
MSEARIPTLPIQNLWGPPKKANAARFLGLQEAGPGVISG